MKKYTPDEQMQFLKEMHHDLLVVMQAAWIEWQHGKGADAAMQWIENTLVGPGLIPKDGEAWSKEAQAYFDANQSRPMPACPCGRPSNIGWMGRGYCCEEHYAADKAMSLN